MEIKYISADIEASGRTPGNYSMLSFGACIVGNINEQFYRELKPINKNYDIKAMRVACRGLMCLEDVKYIDEYNPNSGKFMPDKVLEMLKEKGEEPKDAMNDFAKWIYSSTKGYKPIMASTPIVIDGMWIFWYFDRFCYGKNPLSYYGDEINSMYKVLVKNPKAHIKDLKLKDEIELPHNSLQCAIQNAKRFEKILELMKK